MEYIVVLANCLECCRDLKLIGVFKDKTKADKYLENNDKIGSVSLKLTDATTDTKYYVFPYDRYEAEREKLNDYMEGEWK
jgi:hypothetical protein